MICNASALKNLCKASVLLTIPTCENHCLNTRLCVKKQLQDIYFKLHTLLSISNVIPTLRYWHVACVNNKQ